VFHVKHSGANESHDSQEVAAVQGAAGTPSPDAQQPEVPTIPSSDTGSVESPVAAEAEALTSSAAAVIVAERPHEGTTETASTVQPSADECGVDEFNADESAPDELTTDDHSTVKHNTDKHNTDGALSDHAATAVSPEAADRTVETGTPAAAEVDPIGEAAATNQAEPAVSHTEDESIAEADGRSDDESTPLARELTDITRRRRALASQQLPLPAATRIFTVANQKGGVGKTTSTVNLAAALARQGARVLVIDLDPQGNASTALGVEHRSETVSVYDVIINDDPMASAVQKSPEFEALFCLPATIHLAGAEIELVSLVAREQRLHTALETFLAESAQPFHYVFIDCPPSLGLLTINAFVAANEVLIPIQCEYYALEGLSQLLTNIQLIERHLNPKLAVSTILLTMFDSRTNLANQVAQEVRDHFPDQVLSTLIPRSVRISEAPSYGQSVISYDGNSSGSLSYLEAAAEIARRGVPQ
jgi:chromosome partitioning protein